MAIERPVKLFDFGAVQVAPAYEIDRQFDNHRRSIDAVIKQLAKVVRADGKLNNDLVTPESFPKQALEKIIAAALRDAKEMQTQTQAMLNDVVRRQAAVELSTKELRSLIQRNFADNQTTRVLGEEVQASSSKIRTLLSDAIEFVKRHSVSAFGTPFPNAPLLAPNAGGFYSGDVEGATATAADYAQVSIEWAEHMPDTIPPNILAINAVTGDHWSSRWWANLSANAFGMLAWWYQGAWPSPGPPSTPNTATGQPLPPGAVYWNTTLGAMMVWNGSTWVNMSAPQKGVTASLYYLATAGQTVFPLSVVDRNGKTFAFNQTSPEGVQALVNGVRVEPTYDFTVDTVGSTITFLRALPAGALVIFDLLTPASQLTPSGTVNTVLLNPIVPDGVKTAFTGLTVAMNGHAVNVAKNEELHVSVDGVIQQPGASYSASAATITFLEAPAANAAIFIVWFGPANP
jgi:hypothetical protein